jgi:type IV pilus assembly protein PilC
MSPLTYTVRDQKGSLIRGDSDIRTKEELARGLQAKGFVVISIEEKKGAAAPLRTRKRLHKGVRLDDLTLFARQLAILLESGVAILKAIDVLGNQLESRVLLIICKKIEEDLKTGFSLHEALAKHPKIFSQLWVDLVEMGEATGQLAPVLKKLADYLEAMSSLKKKVISASIYPMMLIAVSFAAIFIFMYKVIPVFAEIYKGFGKLPFLTQMVLNFSNALSKNIVNILIVVVVTVFIVKRYINTEKGRKQFDSLLLKMPVGGSLFLSLAVERFATSLGMMLKGGISIVHALEVSIKSTGNKVVEEALEMVKANVIEGKTIAAPLAETGIFPPLVTQMINVGEESGKLAQLLEEVSKFYGEEISTKITRFVALLEPVILVVMGVVIGTLVAAMYLPIFSLATTAAGGR